MAESDRIPQARALLQQCLHARLQVRPAEGDAESQWVEVTSARHSGTACRGGPSRVLLVMCFPPPHRLSLSSGGAWRRHVLWAVRTSARPAHLLPQRQAGVGLSGRYCVDGTGAFSFRPIPEERVPYLGPREFELRLTFCPPELGGLEA